MLNINKKFLIGLSAMFACMLCFLFVAGMQTQSEPEKENIPLTLLYDNIPDPNMFQTIESLKLQQWMNVNQDILIAFLNVPPSHGKFVRSF